MADGLEEALTEKCGRVWLVAGLGPKSVGLVNVGIRGCDWMLG